MEGSKLKNIVLLILVITNLFLGLLMAYQGYSSRQMKTQTLLDSIALLEARGIAVDPEAIPQDDFPSPMVLERDSQWERQVFTALLGEDTTATQRGLVSYYESGLGRVEVRGDGAFSAIFSEDAFPLNGKDLSQHGLTILSRMELDAKVVSVGEDSLEAVQLWDRSPIFSCAVTLRYENGALVELSGTRLVGTPAVDATQAAPLSIPTLLLRFRGGIIDSGDTCTAILSATQGYVMDAGSAGGGKVRLTPVLRLETDTSSYLVDALTGAMSRG